MPNTLHTFTFAEQRCCCSSGWLCSEAESNGKEMKRNKTFFLYKIRFGQQLYIRVLVSVSVLMCVLSSFLSKFIIFQDVCILLLSYSCVSSSFNFTMLLWNTRFFVNAVCLFYHRCRCRRRHFIFIHSLASRHHLISLHSTLNVLGIRKSKLNE